MSILLSAPESCATFGPDSGKVFLPSWPVSEVSTILRLSVEAVRAHVPSPNRNEISHLWLLQEYCRDEAYWQPTLPAGTSSDSSSIAKSFRRLLEPTAINPIWLIWFWEEWRVNYVQTFWTLSSFSYGKVVNTAGIYNTHRRSGLFLAQGKSSFLLNPLRLVNWDKPSSRWLLLRVTSKPSGRRWPPFAKALPPLKRVKGAELTPNSRLIDCITTKIATKMILLAMAA